MGVASVIPMGSCQLQGSLPMGHPNVWLPICIYSCPSLDTFYNQDHVYFLLSGFQGSRATKLKKSQMFMPKGKGFVNPLFLALQMVKLEFLT